MARARNIKPGLFKNEILGVADPMYTLLFEGLWLLADREGRLEDRPVRIKGELFPYRDGVDMNAMLDWLQQKGFIRRYQACDKTLIQILAFAKHQSPHGTEKDSDLPDENGRYTVHTRGKNGYATGEVSFKDSDLTVKPLCENPLTPDSLIPDSLIPDSGFTDSLIPDLSGQPPAEDRPPRKAKPKEEPKTGPVWQSYCAAYKAKYGVEPVRNATVNGQLAQLVTRLGEEAAFVAEFYLSHRNRFYVEKMHPVGLLLSDAEKLRTEWATGRQITATQALQADKTQTNLDAFSGLIAEAREKERIHG